MEDAAKTLEAIKALVSDEIQNDMIREMLVELRAAVALDDDDSPWAESTITWIVDVWWGDPDA